MSTSLTLSEIAQRLQGKLEGDGQVKITGLAGIREAKPGDLSFIANPQYAKAAAETRASAVIVSADWKRHCSAALIKVQNPDQAFAEAARWFALPAPPALEGIHPTAEIAPDAVIGKNVAIGPFCVIESGARVGDCSVISAGCYIGYQAVLGTDTFLYPHVSIREYCRLGNSCIIHNGTVIGSDGFGYVQDGNRRKKIPQIGIVVIGDDVEIGANVTIDRARFGETRIGRGVKIDNLVQIAHNVVVGDDSVIVAQVGVSGSATIGERVVLAGQVGVVGHLTIGSDVIIGAQSGVTKDVPSKTFAFGSPAQSYERASKTYATFTRLPELRERVVALEQRLAELEQKAKDT